MVFSNINMSKIGIMKWILEKILYFERKIDFQINIALN